MQLHCVVQLSMHACCYVHTPRGLELRLAVAAAPGGGGAARGGQTLAGYEGVARRCRWVSGPAFPHRVPA